MRKRIEYQHPSGLIGRREKGWIVWRRNGKVTGSTRNPGRGVMKVYALPSFCNKCGAPATSFPKSGPKCGKCLNAPAPPAKKKWGQKK